MESSDLDDVISTFQDEKANEPIALELINKWMKSADIEVLGALDSFLFQKNHHLRVQPRIPLVELHRFKLRYLEHCLVSNIENQWVDDRYSAAHDLRSWFVSLWEKKDVPPGFLDELILLLERLYRIGGKDLRSCLVNVTLEHLFERSAIRGRFQNWEKDPVLSEAYSQAMQWIRSSHALPSRQPHDKAFPRLQRSKSVEELTEDSAKELEKYAAHLRQLGQDADASRIESQAQFIRRKIQRRG
jgi:hypothetical protein